MENTTENIQVKTGIEKSGTTAASKENEAKTSAEILSRKIENRYRSFFENIEQGYYETDHKGCFLFLNDFICEILGYSKEELKGKSLFSFLVREDAEKIKEAFRDISLKNKPRVGLVFQVIRKDGIKRQIGTSVCLNRDLENRKIGFRGIARDISERKIQENQMHHTQKLESIGQLAAGIAHEINTPIQYIGDNIQFIQDSFNDTASLLRECRKLLSTAKKGPIPDSMIEGLEKMAIDADVDYILEETPRAVEQSLEGLRHVSEIIAAMKQFCHPGIEEKRGTDINKLIENVITVARNEWKYAAEIKTNFDSELPLVPCIPVEINQVVLNLIINASHAIRDVLERDGRNDKGLIHITTGHDESWAEIRVRDTGTGIPKEARGRIFDPFYTTKEVGKGTGQGLAISHTVVVKKHGGTIDFETETGKGTTMIVRLPLGLEND